VEVYKTALATVNQLLGMHPNSYIYYFMRGFIYYLMNSYSKAQADFETSVKINIKTDKQFNQVIEMLNRSIERNIRK
jgi:tetratricopeptide (TPR) repeat protein